jgi:hypothetical protein
MPALRIFRVDMANVVECLLNAFVPVDVEAVLLPLDDLGRNVFGRLDGPKSASFMCPILLTKRFSGLRSRNMT